MFSTWIYHHFNKTMQETKDKQWAKNNIIKILSIYMCQNPDSMKQK